MTADVRFTVPLYTCTEAAGYLGVPPTTFATWLKGYRREFPNRPPVTGDALVTSLPPDRRGGPAIPFGGLAEGIFLSALRRAGMPLQQIRPMLDLVRTELGIEHVLAARRLYVVGAQLLWEVSTEDDVEEVRHTARDLVVLRDGQYMFRQVIELYLRQITYDDEYARAPGAAALRGRPHRHRPRGQLRQPFFAHGGTLSRSSVTCCGPGRPSRTLRTTSASRSTRSPSSPSARGCSRRDRPAARPRAGAGVQVARRRWSAAVLREVGRSVDGRRAATKGHVSNVCSSRMESCPPGRSPPLTACSRRRSMSCRPWRCRGRTTSWCRS